MFTRHTKQNMITRRNFLTAVGATTVGLALGTADSFAVSKQDRKPNILLIMTDQQFAEQLDNTRFFLGMCVGAVIVSSLWGMAVGVGVSLHNLFRRDRKTELLLDYVDRMQAGLDDQDDSVASK